MTDKHSWSDAGIHPGDTLPTLLETLQGYAMHQSVHPANLIDKDKTIYIHDKENSQHL